MKDRIKKKEKKKMKIRTEEIEKLVEMIFPKKGMMGGRIRKGYNYDEEYLLNAEIYKEVKEVIEMIKERIEGEIEMTEMIGKKGYGIGGIIEERIGKVRIYEGNRRIERYIYNNMREYTERFGIGKEWEIIGDQRFQGGRRENEEGRVVIYDVVKEMKENNKTKNWMEESVVRVIKQGAKMVVVIIPEKEELDKKRMRYMDIEIVKKKGEGKKIIFITKRSFRREYVVKAMEEIFRYNDIKIENMNELIQVPFTEKSWKERSIENIRKYIEKNKYHISEKDLSNLRDITVNINQHLTEVKGDFEIHKFERKLNEKCEREAYNEKIVKENERTVIHWGQRKLLLSEIEFLTLHGKLSNIVVYAGAASGEHIPILSELFPEHKFKLYDPSPFSISPSDKIEIFTGNDSGYFTDSVALSYKSQNVLFISDIRVNNSEEQIKKDMLMQQNWISIMEPSMSMLKFRLPYSNQPDFPSELYLDGDIYFQCWAPPYSNETRLITDGKSSRLYNNKQYEEQLFFFNTHTRVSFYDLFPHSLLCCGLDHCYDCQSELSILRNYVLSFYSIPHSSLFPLILSLSSYFTSSLGKNKRDLFTNIISRNLSDD